MRRYAVRCSGGENLERAASAILLCVIGENCDEGVGAISSDYLTIFCAGEQIHLQMSCCSYLYHRAASSNGKHVSPQKTKTDITIPIYNFVSVPLNASISTTSLTASVVRTYGLSSSTQTLSSILMPMPRAHLGHRSSLGT